jgi:hypothetical protein
MATTTFVDYSTIIPAAWLNDINGLYYNGTGASGVTYTFSNFKLTTATTATSATAGAASALPATPAIYVTININGTNYKFPGYLP